MPRVDVARCRSSGLDGTLRRSRATPGRAHLKTGSLRDVAGVAGYVLSDSGRRYVLVAIVNHPQAGAARPALDALVQWTLRDAPPALNGLPPWTSHDDLLGYLAAALTTGVLRAAGLLTLRTRDVRGISLGMYGAFTLGVALWLAYGLALGDWPIVVANARDAGTGGYDPGDEGASDGPQAARRRRRPDPRPQNGLRCARSMASVASCVWPPKPTCAVVGPQVAWPQWRRRTSVALRAQRQRRGAHGRVALGRRRSSPGSSTIACTASSACTRPT